MYRVLLSIIFGVVLAATLLIADALVQEKEDVMRIPTYAYYEGPFNVAGTSQYLWVVVLKYEFHDREKAGEFLKSFKTWEEIDD